MRISLLLCTVLGLYGYLWYTWIQMAVESTHTPAKQLLNGELQRAETLLYDSFKYPVMMVDTISEPLSK